MIPLRDYHRSSSFPLVTITLIAANALVFLYQQFLLTGVEVDADVTSWVRQWSALGCHVSRQLLFSLRQGLDASDLFTFSYGVTPCEIVRRADLLPVIGLPVWATLFTAMFMHGGWAHILGNMWYLWIFGDNVEDAMGRWRFLFFYLTSGLAAAFAQIVTDPNSVIPMVGASGAIAGVLGAYLALYPFGRVLTVAWFFFFVRFIELPAMILLGFWFVLQFLGGISASPLGGGVAYWAHIGGFVAGLVLVFLFRKRAGTGSGAQDL